MPKVFHRSGETTNRAAAAFNYRIGIANNLFHPTVEDRLLGTLVHEIGHVVNNHFNRYLKKIYPEHYHHIAKTKEGGCYRDYGCNNSSERFADAFQIYVLGAVEDRVLKKYNQHEYTEVNWLHIQSAVKLSLDETVFMSRNPNSNGITRSWK